MAGIDFNNYKGSNLGDPKFDQDAVNLRTLTRAIGLVSGNTVSAVVSGITSGNSSFQGLTAVTISATTISGATGAIQGTLYLNDDITQSANPDLRIASIYNQRILLHDNNTNADWFLHTQAFGGGAGYGNFGIGTSSNNANNFLTIGTGGTTNITRLGVNTNTPLERLGVNGNAILSGGLSAATGHINTLSSSTVFISGNSGNILTVRNSGGNTGLAIDNSGLQAAFYAGGGINYPVVVSTTTNGIGFASNGVSIINSSLAQLIVQTGNTSIGIGSFTTALAKLDVSGNTLFRSNSVSGLSVFNSTGTTPTLVVNTSANTVGNVGIRVSNPASPFEVSGGSNSHIVGKFWGDSSRGASAQFTRAGSYDWSIGTGGATGVVPASSFGIYDTTAGALRMIFTHTNGLVGINTSAPRERLEVSGNVYISGGLTASTLSAATFSANSIYADSFTAGTNGGYYAFDSSNIARHIATFSGENIRLLGRPGVSDIYLDPTSGSSIGMYVKGSNGFVGIGTASPFYKFHLRNATAGTVSVIGGTVAAIENNSTNYMTFIQPDANVGGITWGSPSDPFGAYVRWGYTQNQLDISTSTSGGILNFMAGSDVPVMTMSSTQMNLFTNNLQRGVLNSTGKFGLGTTSPIEQLHITGNTLIGGGLTGSSAVISGNTRVADGILFVSRLQDVNLSMISANVGSSNTNAFQLNIDQPNSKSNLDARNGFSLGFQISDAEKALLTSSNFQVLVPISASTISATTLSILGAGSTSATTAVTISNSSGTNLLTINNSGQTNFGNYATPATQRSFTFGQESAFMSMGSITNSPSAFGVYANQSVPSNSNFSFNLTSTNTSINAPSSTLNLQVAAGTRYALTNTTHSWTSGQMSSSSGVNFSFTAPFATSSPSGTNISKFSIILNTNQWSTGAIPAQDFVSISQPSVLFVGASTATTVSTFSIAGAPSASTNSTLGLTTAFLIKPGIVSGPGSAITSFGAYINAQSGALTNYALGVNGDVIITGNTSISNALTASTFNTTSLTARTISNGTQLLANGESVNFTGATILSAVTATTITSSNGFIKAGYGSLISQSSVGDFLTSQFISNGGLFISSRQTQAIGFHVNAVEKMRLTGAGLFGIGTNAPRELLEVSGNTIVSGFTASTTVTTGGIIYGYRELDSNYTITRNDYTLNCTANTFTVTLPTAIGIQGQVYNIKNMGSGTITLSGSSSQTIDEQYTQSIVKPNNIKVQSTGANWIII